MKYFFVMIITIFSLFFIGCKQKIIEQNDAGLITSGVDTNLIEIQQSPLISTGNVFSGAIISGSNYFVIITGNRLVYSGLFSIAIPKNLQIRTNEYQGAEIIRLDFGKDALPDSWSEGYFKLYVEDVPSRKKENNDKDKCVLGEYDEGVISNKTTTKSIGDKTIFMTKLTYYVMAAPELDIKEKKREQGDLCFLNNGIIYRISVGSYDKIHIQQTLDSFQFIN